jgi:hypothetical protein
MCIRDSNYTYVAWNWKANGGTTSTIAVDSVSSGVPSIASTVQANTDAGFSIVTYTAYASSGVYTIGHGLSQAPELIINKNRDSSGAWWSFTTLVDGSVDYVRLDDTNAKADDTQSLSLPTTTTFGMNEAYTLQQNVVSYCFHSVEGYSRFGKYTGNSSLDGTFVYLGFKPSFVMLKDIGGGEWGMFDSARNTFNVVNKLLQANVTDAEYSGDTNRDMDFLSNGFKLRNGSAIVFNNSSRTYIYMAFAETPTKYSLAR